MQSPELRSSIFNNWQFFYKRKRAVLYLTALMALRVLNLRIIFND